MRRVGIVLIVVAWFLVAVVNLYAETIEAENYNEGGERVAYHDTTPENLGNYSPREGDGVDLFQTGDGAVRIGWIENGEWLKYDYDFARSGTYKFTFFVATGFESAPTAKISIDGETIGNIEIPKTGGYSNFVPVNFEADVMVGKRTIAIECTEPYFDFDKFEIESLSEFDTGKINVTCQYPEADHTPDEFRFFIRYDDQATWPANQVKTASTCNAMINVKKNVTFFVVVRAVKDGREGPGSEPVESIYSEKKLSLPAPVDVFVKGF